MRVLLTGANGFIGKNIFETLSKAHDFYKIPHKDIDLNSENLITAFKDIKPDAVIHCAVKPSHRLALDFSDITLTNLKMFLSLNKCVKDNKVEKFIVIGSGSEFNMARNLDNTTEEDIGKSIPPDETGFSKYIINELIQKEKNAVNLRCFGVFGKYEDYNLRFISNCIVKAIFNKDIIINEDKKFSYLYIDDLVKIVDIFLSSTSKFNDYNITPDYVYSIFEIAELVKEITKSKSEIKVIRNGCNYTGSNLRFKKEFDFKFTPFKFSVEELYKYYLSIKNELLI